MAPNYKIAVIQLYLEPLSPASNFSRACTYIRSAAAQSCTLAVLPEYHLTNWLPEDPNFAELCSDFQKYIDGYCALAKELGICIVPGTIVEKRGEELTNVATFISSTGEILHSYTKKNLWHPERPHLTPSPVHEPHAAFDTPLGRVGILICWDLAFPEAFRALIAEGAKTIIIPTFWTKVDGGEVGKRHNKHSEGLFLGSTLTARAFENTCAVVFCNAGGPGGPGGEDGEGGKGEEDFYLGMSQVVVPFKGPIMQLGEEEGMGVVDLDMDILEDAEGVYGVRKDIAGEGWHYGYSIARE